MFQRFLRLGEVKFRSRFSCSESRFRPVAGFSQMTPYCSSCRDSNKRLDDCSQVLIEIENPDADLAGHISG